MMRVVQVRASPPETICTTIGILSVVSSLAVDRAATSRTVKWGVTVGVAPSFKSSQRAAQRKQLYTKLEQKHQALKAEKMEYKARTKEEQEEAIKQMRKSMVVKANPVPSFYHEGPPPKVELKKLCFFSIPCGGYLRLLHRRDIVRVHVPPFSVGQ